MPETLLVPFFFQDMVYIAECWCHPHLLLLLAYVVITILTRLTTIIYNCI